MADKSEQVKTIENIIAGYEDWLKKYGSMGYMSSEGREGHIKEQLKQLAKTNYDVYTAMLDSIAHGKIEVSDDLKGIFNEFIKQRETEGKSRTNRGKLYEVVDKDLRALKTPEDKKAFANRLEAYARQNGYANDYYKTAVVLVASKEYSEDVENMVRDVQKKTNERTNTEKKVQQPIDNLTREQADVMLRGLPSPLSDEQKRVFTGFLKGASREDDPSHKIYLAVLDLVNNPETAKNYSDEVKNLVKESAKKQEHTTDNNISFGNTAATNHSRTSDNSGSAGGNMTLSANMKYALNMGPTVLKEELEAMGYKFDVSMIRHGANGDYIPTSKLKAWMEKQEFTDEQINRLNALVDDRAAFNAKVKEINNRDNYVAPAPKAKATHEHTAAAPKAEAAQEHAAAPAAKEKPAAEQEQSAPEKTGIDKMRDDFAKLEAVDTATYNKYMSAFKTIANGNDDSGVSDEMMLLITKMMKQYGYDDNAMCDFARDAVAIGNDIAHGPRRNRAENQSMAATAEGNTRESGAVEEDPKVKEDKEKARELLKKDPKKFEKARAAYKAAGEEYYLGIMDEVAAEAKADVKSKAKKDKAKADQATQEVKEEQQKKSLKKALKNRANDVGSFFKKTFGIKTKKDKEKESTAAVEQQKAEEMQKAVASRKITLEHDKDGNAVYTLSGYGRFDGGDHNGLYDGKYTVYQFGNASAVKFAANDGSQFTDYSPGGQQLSLIQTLKDEMAARSSEQAQVAARAAAQQKTNS